MFKTINVTPRKDGRLELTRLIRDNVGGAYTVMVRHQRRGRMLSIHLGEQSAKADTDELMVENTNGRYFYTPPVVQPTYGIQVTNKYIHIR